MKSLVNIFGYIVLLSLVILTSCDDNENERPVSSDDVRVFKIDAVNDRLYLKNFGDATIDVSTFWVCNLRSYGEGDN